MRRVLATALLALAGCDRASFDLSGLPCDAEGCITGYDCRPDTNTCQPTIARGCAAGQICWQDERTGGECSVEGAYLPCGEGPGCEHGCRTCSGGVWTACETSACQLGIVASCGSCTEDCATIVDNADADCDTRGGSNSCSYDTCLNGFFDADEVRRNGCECSFAGTEMCNGVDDDCSGAVDDDRDIASTCFVILAAAGHVRAWTCDNRCLVDECEAGWIDADTNAATGCERECTPDNTIDRCDGRDNECNGVRDDVTDVNADCGAQRPAAQNVASWSCSSAGACEVASCAGGWTNGNPSHDDGCETPCTPTNGGVERCDAVDNDCNGIPDDVPAATMDGVCGPLNPGAQFVSAWRCAAAQCAATCLPNHYDDNGIASDGCEYACTPTGAEVCDNADNDCDADGDTNDTDLDDPSEWTVACAGANPAAARVTAWECREDGCRASSCEPGFYDINTRANDGCEYSCTPIGIEVCDPADRDEDCNGQGDDGEGRLGCTTFYRDDDGDLRGIL